MVGMSMNSVEEILAYSFDSDEMGLIVANHPCGFRPWREGPCRICDSIRKTGHKKIDHPEAILRVRKRWVP